MTSDSVRGLAAGKKFLFSDRGETAMRGFEDPVRLFEVRWREEDWPANNNHTYSQVWWRGPSNLAFGNSGTSRAS